MANGKKILERLKKQDGNVATIPWVELVALLKHLGYDQLPAKGGGSGMRFHNSKTSKLVLLHKPHPENEICGGAVKSVIRHLREEGIL